MNHCSRYLQIAAFAAALITNGFAQTPGGALVRAYNAMPLDENPARLAVAIGEKTIVKDITPGETTFQLDFPAEAAPVTVKNAGGEIIGRLPAAPIKDGSLLTLILAADGKNVNVIPVSANITALAAAIKAPETAVFVPVNLSPDVEYTFEIQTHDSPPKETTITIKPFSTAQIPINFGRMDWKLTGHLGDKTFAVPPGRFPSLDLLKNHAAILILPAEKATTEIVALDAVDNGFIQKDQ